MKHLILLMAFIVLFGCDKREVAKATIQTQQALQGALVIVQSELEPAIQQGNKETIQGCLVRLTKLLESGQSSIRPAIDELTSGDKSIVPDTSIQEAIHSTDQFVHKASMQTGRAQQQADDNNYYRSMVLDIGGSLLDQIMALTLGASPLAGLLAVKVKRNFDLRRKANEDEVAYTEEVATAKTDEEIAAVKSKHMKRQLANGTHSYLYNKRKKAT